MIARRTTEPEIDISRVNVRIRAASNAAVMRAVSVVHGLLTAATVLGVLGVHGLGAWLTVALGHRPHPCVDDIHHWSFELAAYTTGWLMVAAIYGVLIWLPATVVEAAADGQPRWRRTVLVLRVGLVLLAWISLWVDPLGGWAWFLD